jgi:hypothetical protein
MRHLIRYITASTLKREYAAFLTVWLLGMATSLLYRDVVSEMQYRILELFAYPILVGAFGVFGLDWISKQTTIAGPPANTETTVKAEVTDNVATLTTTSEQTP